MRSSIQAAMSAEFCNVDVRPLYVTCKAALAAVPPAASLVSSSASSSSSLDSCSSVFGVNPSWLCFLFFFFGFREVSAGAGGFEGRGFPKLGTGGGAGTRGAADWGFPNADI